MTHPDTHHAGHQGDDQGEQDLGAVRWRRAVEEVADAARWGLARDADGRPRAARRLPGVTQIAARYELGPVLATRVREAAAELDHIRHPHGPGRRTRTDGSTPAGSTPTAHRGIEGSTPDRSGVEASCHRGIEGSTPGRDATGRHQPGSSATEAVAGHTPDTPRSPARYRATGAVPASLPDPATAGQQTPGPGSGEPAGPADRDRSSQPAPGPRIDRPHHASGLRSRTQNPESGSTPDRPSTDRTRQATANRPPGPQLPRTSGDRPRRPGIGKGRLVARPQDGSRARANLAARRSGTGPSAPGPGTGPVTVPGTVRDRRTGTGDRPAPGTADRTADGRSRDGWSGDGRLSGRQVGDLAELIHAALSAAHAVGMADADDLAGRRVSGPTLADLAARRDAASQALWAGLYDLRADW